MDIQTKINLIKEMTEKHADYIGQEIIHINSKEYTPEMYSVEMGILFNENGSSEDFKQNFLNWLNRDDKS
jgi:hypothetical protein